MKKAMQLIAVLGLVAGVSSAVRADLVTNGGFETTTINGVTTHASGQLSNGGYALTDWTNLSDGHGHFGYNFVFAPGTADTSGAGSSHLKLWGPGDFSYNGLPATSPTGGNYVAADGAYETGAISQTINGLTIGNTYAVSFWYAGAQQHGYDGPTTEAWKVSLGNMQFKTPVLHNATHGFTGWKPQTFNYTATATSEALQFLAVGTPSGEPPFSLLDGVTVTPTTPEGSSLALLVMGLGSIGFVARRGSRAAKSAKSGS